MAATSTTFGDDFVGRAAGLLDLGDVEVALLLVLDDRRVLDRGEARRFQEPGTACSGALTRGPFFSSDIAGDFAGTPSTTSVSRRGVA